MDAELDSDQEQDIDQVLGAWLGELENMTKQLDSEKIDVSLPTSPLPQPSYDMLDNFRFSQFNLQTQVSNGGSPQGDSQDVDLDALLGDLCEMEQNLQEQMGGTELWAISSQKAESKPPSLDSSVPPPPPPLPPPQGGASDAVYMDDLPPPPPMDEDQPMESDSRPFPAPPPPPPTGQDSVQSAPPPPPPPPPLPSGETDRDSSSIQTSAAPPPQRPSSDRETIAKPGSLSISVSPSNSATTVSESQEGTASPDSTRTAGTHSPLPSRKLEPGANQSPGPQLNWGPAVEVTPSSPAPHSIGPTSPRSPPFQPPPANLSKSVRVKLKEIEDQLENDPSLTEEERQAKIKAEKIKIALEKLKKANIQKLIVRVYTDEGSSKTVFLDETMFCRVVTSMMIEKNHLEYKPGHAIIEQVPDLYMERIVEDHENLVNDVLLNWKRETTCRILFSERKEKYAIFRNPQNYLLSASSSQAAQQFAEKSKEVLIKEFFSDTGSQIPEVEGALWMKAEGKKSWKRFYFILRASGLYFSPKGKSKSSKDLVCLVGFEHNHAYHGVGWKKKYKAPTDHCFAIKHPQLQQRSKYIKYLCAEDYRSCQRWMAGIRLAKYGKQLLGNYIQTQKEMTAYKARHLADGTPQTNGMTDSVSLSSMQSSVSSHSSSSGSLHDSRSSRASLSVYQPTQTLPLQSNAPTRRGTVGNMFANAWKQGKDSENSGNSNLDTYNGKFIQSPNSDQNPEFPRPAIVTPTKSRRPTDTMTEFEVQRALKELEFHLDITDNQVKGASKATSKSQQKLSQKPKGSAPVTLANLFIPPTEVELQSTGSSVPEKKLKKKKSSPSPSPQDGRSPRSSMCSSKASPHSSVSSATSVQLLQSKQAWSPPMKSAPNNPPFSPEGHPHGGLSLKLTSSSGSSPPTSPREKSPLSSPISPRQKAKRPIPVQLPTVPPSFKSATSPVDGAKTPPALRPVQNGNNPGYHLVMPAPNQEATAQMGPTAPGPPSPASPLTPTQKRRSCGSPVRRAPPPPVRSPTTKLVNRLSGSEEQFVYDFLGRPDTAKMVQFRDSWEEIPTGAHDCTSSLHSASSPGPYSQVDITQDPGQCYTNFRGPPPPGDYYDRVPMNRATSHEQGTVSPVLPPPPPPIRDRSSRPQRPGSGSGYEQAGLPPPPKRNQPIVPPPQGPPPPPPPEIQAHERYPPPPPNVPAKYKVPPPTPPKNLMHSQGGMNRPPSVNEDPHYMTAFPPPPPPSDQGMYNQGVANRPPSAHNDYQCIVPPPPPPPLMTQQRSNIYDRLVRTPESTGPRGPQSPQSPQMTFPRQASPTRVAPQFLNELNSALVKPRNPKRNSFPNQPPSQHSSDPGRPPVMPKPPGTKPKPSGGRVTSGNVAQPGTHVQYSPSSHYSPSNGGLPIPTASPWVPQKVPNPAAVEQSHQANQRGGPDSSRGHHSVPNSPQGYNSLPGALTGTNTGPPPVQPKPNKSRQGHGPRPPPAPPRSDATKRQSDYV